MKDRSDGPSHHERTLLPRSYISLRPLVGVFGLFRALDDSSCSRCKLKSVAQVRLVKFPVLVAGSEEIANVVNQRKS